MSPFDTGYEEERGRDAFRRERYGKFDTLVTLDRHGNITRVGDLSLRDWFAGQALAGLMQSNDVSANPAAYARLCFTQADAMLEARK